MTSSWVSSRVRRDHVRRSGAAAHESRAEEALAADGVPRMRLGYEVLGKLKVDKLLEREDLPADARASHGDPETTTVES
jgi:hypothetical protein